MSEELRKKKVSEELKKQKFERKNRRKFGQRGIERNKM